MEEMVEAAVYLCDCDAETTGQVFVSLDLIADRGVTVMTLDGGGALEQRGSVRGHDRDQRPGDRPARRRPLRRRPVPHLRVDARARAGLLGRAERAVGHRPLRRHRRDREGEGRLHQLRHGEGRLPAEPAVRPVDHRPRRPAAHEAPQAREPRLHAAHGAGVGGPRPGDRHRAARRRRARRTASSSSRTSPGRCPRR